MKTIFRYLMCFTLVITYTSLSLGTQFVVLKSMISSGSESTIDSEMGKSHPPETRPFWTQRKYAIPAPNTDSLPALAGERHSYCDTTPERMGYHAPLYSILISHFPYPPFWPRDPSLA